MTDNENPTTVTVGEQNAEPTKAHLTLFESSMADIRQNLQQLLAQSTVHNQSSSSGIAVNASLSQSSVVFSNFVSHRFSLSVLQHVLFCKTCVCCPKAYSQVFVHFHNRLLLLPLHLGYR